MGTSSVSAFPDSQHRSSTFPNGRLGQFKYPHPYGYKDADVKFPEAACKKGDALQEFPNTQGLFTGKPVGLNTTRQLTTDIPDTLVFKTTGKTAIFCGLMTYVVRLCIGGRCYFDEISCLWFI